MVFQIMCVATRLETLMRCVDFLSKASLTNERERVENCLRADIKDGIETLLIFDETNFVLNS
jgi:hypothetical protein